LARNCLGNEFRKETFFLVLAQYEDSDAGNGQNIDKGRFDEMLETLVADRYLETSDGVIYRFVHDKIQESAMALNDEGDISVEDIEANIFVVANLRKNATSASSEIAELNLRAAGKSSSLCDELALELYSIGAETECTLGNFEKADEYCKVVTESNNIPLDQKARAYFVQISTHQALGRLKVSLDLALDIANQLGCTV